MAAHEGLVDTRHRHAIIVTVAGTSAAVKVIDPVVVSDGSLLAIDR